MWVRVCTATGCGQPDLTRRWEIAARQMPTHPAWSEPWRCRRCGGSAFALMERDEVAPDDWLIEDEAREHGR